MKLADFKIILVQYVDSVAQCKQKYYAVAPDSRKENIDRYIASEHGSSATWEYKTPQDVPGIKIANLHTLVL